MKKRFYIIVIVSIIMCIFLSCNSVDLSDDNIDESINKSTNEKQTAEHDYNNENYSFNSIQPDSVEYLGAFLLPEDGNNEKEMFSYGGEAMCYNAAADSLFITGHNWHTYISEITIEQPVISKDINKMNKAEIIKDFADIKGNLFSKWTMEIPRVGLEVVDDKLFFCFGEHYEEDTSLGTHGYTNLDLSKTDKVCVAGDFLYSTNDYLFSIPDKYFEVFNGKDLLTGRFRDGGWSGMGPALFAVSSSDIINAANNQSIQAQPIIKYDDSYNGDKGYKMNDYSHADSWTGGAFVSCDAGDAILFVGTHSFGSAWYGFSDGTVYPTDGDENAVYPDVPDYPHDERGWWSDDFRACVVLYSPEVAAKVVLGEIQPCEIQPYAFIDLSEYMIVKRDETDMQYLGGAAYDIENNRLFILELFADDDKPIVHVFTFK